MSIEQLGESLLSQAKKRRKKEERKGKIFGAVLLGAQVGNIFLRNKAKKRADEFWKSNIGLVNQKASQFDKGIKFWTDHSNMMSKYGTGKTDTNWEDAFKQQQYDIYKKRELDGTKPQDIEEFKNIINNKITDDLNAYKEKLNLFKEFKNIGRTEADIKISKTAYIKPIQDKLNKAAELIQKESNVGGYLLNRLGVGDRQKLELERQDILGTTLLLPKGFDTTALELDIQSNNKFLKELSDIDNKVMYQPMTREERVNVLGAASVSAQPIASHRTSLNRALSSDPAIRAQSTLNEYTFELNNKNVNIRKLYTMLQDDKQGGQEAATDFVSSILTYSRQAEIEFEKQNKEGLVKSAEYFLKQGIDRAVANHFTINGKVIKTTGTADSFDPNEKFSLQLPGMGEPAEFKLGNIQTNFTTILEEGNKQKIEMYLKALKDNKLDIINPVFFNTLEDLYNKKFKKPEKDILANALQSGFKPFGVG